MRSAAALLGSKGGRAFKARQTPGERSESARRAAATRWARHGEDAQAPFAVRLTGQPDPHTEARRVAQAFIRRVRSLGPRALLCVDRHIVDVPAPANDSAVLWAGQKLALDDPRVLGVFDARATVEDVTGEIVVVVVVGRASPPVKRP